MKGSSAAPIHDADSDRRASWKWLALLSGATVLVYRRGLTGRFVWDDRLFFLDNDILPALRPWDFREILLHPTTYWRDQIPVTNFLFVLEYNLFGTSTVGYHAVSLLLYLATGLAVFVLTRAVYEGADASRAGFSTVPTMTWRGVGGRQLSALVVTALFMLHPVHVETVAYIVGQKDLLYGLFSLWSLYFFHRALRSDRSSFVPAVAFYYLAFLSKNMAVANAIFIPVFWLLFVRKRADSTVKALLAWVIVNLPVALWLLHTVIHGMSSFGTPTPLPERIVRGFKVLGAHTSLVLKPYPLNFGYPFDGSSSLDLNLWLGAALVAALLYLIVKSARSLVTLGFLLYFVYLLPVLQVFVEISNATVFDRYLFLSLLGASIVFERGLTLAYASWARFRRLTWGLLAAVGLLLTGLTAAYVPKFESDVASLRHAYEHFPGWTRPPFDYVYALIEDGQLDLAEAITQTEASFEEPAWVRPYFRGWILLERGETESAVAPLTRAFYLCGTGGYFPYPAVPLGRAYLAQGDVLRARATLRYALRGQYQNPLEFYKAKVLLEEIEARESATPTRAGEPPRPDGAHD